MKTFLVLLVVALVVGAIYKFQHHKTDPRKPPIRIDPDEPDDPTKPPR